MKEFFRLVKHQGSLCVHLLARKGNNEGGNRKKESPCCLVFATRFSRVDKKESSRPGREQEDENFVSVKFAAKAFNGT